MDSGRKPFESIFDLESQLLLKILDPHYQLKGDDFTSINWDHFLYVLQCHRVTTHVYQQGSVHAFLPPAVKKKLREHNAAIQYRMLGYMAELSRILILLEQNAIPVIVVKGPVLGQLYYGHYTQRECNDLDILVNHSDHKAAYILLANQGYSLDEAIWNSPRQEKVYQKNFHHYSLYHSELHIQLELHWGLNANLYSDVKELDALWTNSQVQKIGRVHTHTLSRYDNFIYLCIHGGAHNWKRLFWLLDIAQILRKENKDFLNEVYQRAVAKKVGNYILLACSLVHILFRVSLPEGVLTELQRKNKIKKLVAIAASYMQEISVSDRNPLKDLSSFKDAFRHILNSYLSKYYQGGGGAIIASFKKFFINPRYWKLYAFSDRLFFLNYAAAPFLWVYSIINKYNR